MEDLEFHLDQFEGPLDLLITLIQKHKLDIQNISIVELVDQYMSIMGHVQEENMEIASSFMEMAARLVYIKSVTLLPRHEEEAEELKAELQGQLIEYQLVQKLANMLGKQYTGERFFVRETMEIEDDRPYSVKHRMQDLLEAYALVLGKTKHRLPPPKTAFSGLVNRRIVSVESRVVFVLHELYEREKVLFSDLFVGSEETSEKVATFLAVLELVRGGRIILSEDNREIQISPAQKVKEGVDINESSGNG